jgi:hypothetical protein
MNQGCMALFYMSAAFLMYNIVYEYTVEPAPRRRAASPIDVGNTQSLPVNRLRGRRRSRAVPPPIDVINISGRHRSVSLESLNDSTDGWFVPNGNFEENK